MQFTKDGTPAFIDASLREIHRRSRRRSPNPGSGLGVSELFSASAADREIVLDVIDRGHLRLAMYLLGQLEEHEVNDRALVT